MFSVGADQDRVTEPVATTGAATAESGALDEIGEPPLEAGVVVLVGEVVELLGLGKMEMVAPPGAFAPNLGAAEPVVPLSEMLLEVLETPAEFVVTSDKAAFPEEPPHPTRDAIANSSPGTSPKNRQFILRRTGESHS
jgi:hypothetical protein